MKTILFLLMATVGSVVCAKSLPEGQRLAEIQTIQSNDQFPNTVIEVVYTRACGEHFVDVLTRSQLAAGKNYLEVGALVEQTNRHCQMNELPFVQERAFFKLNSYLPLVLLDLDLSIDLHAPIKPGGATVGNF